MADNILITVDNIFSRIGNCCPTRFIIDEVKRYGKQLIQFLISLCFSSIKTVNILISQCNI